MSLRAFHVLFIALSIVLAAFLAAWANGQYRLSHEAQYGVMAVVAVVIGAGLALYGAAFLKKTRNL
jgi:hypothetical protein